jgi:hypothetical protein|nr:MAG TPA: hypothetical protein [Crassvirales sp.]
MQLVHLRRPCGEIRSFVYFEYPYTLKVGDLVIEKTLNEPLEVVQIIEDRQRLNMIDTRFFTELNIVKISTPSYRYNNQNNMIERTVKVSIEQARCWFNGNNKALKELALTVYSEQELTLSYESIKLQLGDNNLTTTCVTVPHEEHDKFDVNAKLCLMAKYFNGNWKRTPYNKGYFIGQSKQGFTTSRDMGNSLGICVHETVVYAGIVYFKDEESAIKAFKMLTELDKEILFG